MSTQIRALKARKAAALQSARAIADKTSAENRDFTSDEQAQFDQHMASAKQIDAQITNLEALADAEAGMGTAVEVGGKGATVITKDNRADDPKHQFASFGEYCRAVRVASAQGNRPDERLLIGAAAPTSSDEGTGAEGGWLVPPEYSRDIWRLSLTEDSMLPLTDNTPVQGNSMVFPSDETTPWGTDGVRAYWAAEAAQATATKMKIGTVQMRLSKLMALVPVTDELAADASAISSYLLDKVSTSIRWKTNEAIFKGTGAGQPQGLMNSNAIVEVAKESGQAASTLDPKNLAKMIARLPPGSFGRAIWLITNDALPALFTLTLGNYPIYLPVGTGSGSLADSPYGSLLGRPVIVSQHAEAFSSAGDVQLHDLSYYRTITKAAGAIDVATSMHLYFDYDIEAFRATFRVDGGPKLKAAIAQAKGSNTLSPFVRLGAR